MIGCIARWPVMIASRITSSGSSLRGGLDHQHGVARAGDGQVEQRLVVELAHGGIDDQLAVQIAHLDGGHRALERNARDGQRGAGADDAQDGGVVLLVGRHDQVHDLDVVAVVLGEERPYGPVGHAGGEGALFAGPAFALDEAARDLARGVHALFVLNGQREKINALTRFGRRDRRSEQSGVTVGDQDGAIGQASEATGLERHRTPGDFDFYFVRSHKFFFFLSPETVRREWHAAATPPRERRIEHNAAIRDKGRLAEWRGRLGA